jgi:hypothetical protein
MGKMEQHFFDETEAMAMLDCQKGPDQESPEVQWILTNYPGIEEGSEEWGQASLHFTEMMECELAILDQVWFEASLNDIGDRYAHAIAELDDLLPLQADSQPGIVRRLAYGHCVTVMEAFLMYSACALLNHPPHLVRFHDKKSEFLRGDVVKVLDAAYLCERGNDELCLWRGREVPGHNELEWTGVTFADLQRYKSRAQAEIGALAFHNIRRIKAYFSAMLTTPPDWPLDEKLQDLVDTRQDLVHRNGVTKYNQPITIAPHDVAKAVETVRRFITLAYDDFQVEISLYHGDAREF